MLKLCSFLALLVILSVPAALADPVNSTINTPNIGYTYTGIPRENDVVFSEQNLEQWNQVLNVTQPNIQPIFFPVLVMVIFGISFYLGMNVSGNFVSGMFFILATLMSLILVLLFSGNLEFGLLQEETSGTIDTNTGLFEVSKTYHSTKLIPTDQTFRPILSMVFYMLFFFCIVMFIVKSFVTPLMKKRQAEKDNSEN